MARILLIFSNRNLSKETCWSSTWARKPCQWKIVKKNLLIIYASNKNWQVNLSRKNCSCKWGLIHRVVFFFRSHCRCQDSLSWDTYRASVSTNSAWFSCFSLPIRFAFLSWGACHFYFYQFKEKWAHQKNLHVPFFEVLVVTIFIGLKRKRAYQKFCQKSRIKRKLGNKETWKVFVVPQPHMVLIYITLNENLFVWNKNASKDSF